jgi:hypothetical protein
VDYKQNRVVLVLTPDPDPLIDSAYPHEALLRDSASPSDLQSSCRARLPESSVNKKSSKKTKNDRRRTESPNHVLS